MTLDNDLDQPFGAGKAIEKTWEQHNLDNPEEEEINPDDVSEEDIMDDPDDADQLDEAEAEDGPYDERPRVPLIQDLV